VGDEEVRQAELVLQVLHQVDDLRLDRDVERRHRLVRDDEVGLDRQRPRNADALTLPAGELVRVAVGVIGVQADGLHQVRNLLLAVLAVLRQPVDDHSPWMISGSAMMLPTLMRGFSEA